jgi:hypothetical protein
MFGEVSRGGGGYSGGWAPFGVRAEFQYTPGRFRSFWVDSPLDRSNRVQPLVHCFGGGRLRRTGTKWIS